jgi:hypothetical protein
LGQTRPNACDALCNSSRPFQWLLKLEMIENAAISQASGCYGYMPKHFFKQ